MHEYVRIRVTEAYNCGAIGNEVDVKGILIRNGSFRRIVETMDGDLILSDDASLGSIIRDFGRFRKPKVGDCLIAQIRRYNDRWEATEWNFADDYDDAQDAVAIRAGSENYEPAGLRLRIA